MAHACPSPRWALPRENFTSINQSSQDNKIPRQNCVMPKENLASDEASAYSNTNFLENELRNANSRITALQIRNEELAELALAPPPGRGFPV